MLNLTTNNYKTATISIVVFILLVWGGVEAKSKLLPNAPKFELSK
jgi:hypothetical protein